MLKAVRRLSGLPEGRNKIFFMFLAGIEVPVPRRFHCAGHIKNVGLHFYLHLAVLGYLGSQIKQYSPRSNVERPFYSQLPFEVS